MKSVCTQISSLFSYKFMGLFIALLFSASTAQARIYDAREIAVAPGGVDVQRGMALTNHFWLQVVGPDIAAELVQYAQECAAAAIADGVTAARMTPSPEPSARINAGMLAAQATLRACAAVRPAIGYVAGQFSVQIGQQAEWTPNASFQAPDPMAPVYQGAVDRLPDWARPPAQSGYDAWNTIQHPQIQVPVPKVPDIPNPTIRNGRGCFGLFGGC